MRKRIALRRIGDDWKDRRLIENLFIGNKVQKRSKIFGTKSDR